MTFGHHHSWWRLVVIARENSELSELLASYFFG
jgi:hypothetical protein